MIGNALGMSFVDKLRSKSPESKVLMSMLGSEAVALFLGQYGPIAAKKAVPSLREKLISTVSNNIVQPNIDSFQDSMEDMFHAKEDREKWAEAKKGGIKSRGDFMAEHITDIALTFPASFGSALIAKKGIDLLIEGPVSNKNFIIGSLGEGAIHLGLMGILPKVAPEQMGTFKTAMSKTLQKVGVDKETAEKYAMNFTYSGLADAIGFSANFLYQLATIRGKTRA